MNKVFIRTRQIDNNKQLPILLRENDDLTDLNEYSNISKSSQILSGMDKGEESEHHLQEVLRELQYEKTVFNKAIPIPEVIDESSCENLYKTDFKLPKHYIRLKTLDFEDELPEYDMDEEDKDWLDNSGLNITPLKFEQIIEQFEKACCHKALLLDEAKSLLRHEAVHLVIAIYDYWLTKRVNTGQTLILSVKVEKAERCNNTPIDPYIAFRKRSEKMTTRKNRRVDEASYEKMFRLRYQMEKLSEIIQLVSKREATKSQITQNERDIFVKRYEARDYDKLQLKESEITIKRQSIKLGDNFKSAQRSREENQKETRRKRTHSKSLETNQSPLEHQSEDIDFTFKPMAKCKYLPSRFSIIDNNDNNTNNINNNFTKTGTLNDIDNYHNQTNDSIDNPKSFHISKLSYLSEPLQRLNAPIRFRMNSNNQLSIDVQITNPTNQRLQPSQSPLLSSPHPHSISSHAINSLPFTGIPVKRSKITNQMIDKLKSLYYRNIFCGLPPISSPTQSDTSANYTHISLPRQTASSDSIKPEYSHTPLRPPINVVTTSSHSLSNGNHFNHSNISNLKSVECIGGNRSSSSSSTSINHSLGTMSSIESNKNINSHDYRPCNKPSSLNHNHNKKISILSNDHISLSISTITTTSSSTSFTATANSKPSSLSNSKSFLSNHQNGNICTYQNSYFNHNNKSDTGNKNCAFINESSDHHHHCHNNQQQQQQSQHRQVNGNHRKTTATKDLVESQTNHSLNGGFKNKLSKVGLNCFKTLTNKRVIPRKDINEIASFYSKSNGHQHTWLKQSAPDNCLTPNLVMPWKSEPQHVMTSVNKMT